MSEIPETRRRVSLRALSRTGLVAVLIAALAACASGPSAGEPFVATPASPSPAGGAASGSGADGAAVADLSGRLVLRDLLLLALERNPAIHAARERASAAAEGPVAESWLPNPMVTLGWYETSVETRVGPQEASLSVSQAIPFPTKLVTKGKIEESEARRLLIVYERTAQEVLADVIRTAHEIAYLDEAVAITAAISPLLDRYVAAAAGGETGTLLPELFRAETQRAQLDNDRVILVELREAETQHLRSLLDLPPEVPVGTPLTGPVPPVDATLSELTAVAEARSQELREAELALETAQLRSSLAEQARLPDLTVGATRIVTDRLDRSLGMDPRGNGDDAVILSLGISLPIWAHRDTAAIRRAQAMERAAALERSRTVQTVRDRLARQWFLVHNAERLERLYDEVLVPRAAAAARTAEDLMAAGKGGLAGALETIAVYHNFRLAAARARADHGRAVADLEAVLGRPFAPAPAAEEEEER